MSRILKWQARVSQDFTLPIHPESKIVLVERQEGAADGTFCIWNEDGLLPGVAREATGWFRHFTVVGTGHEVPRGATHVASWQEPPFVWHLFELERP
jgi:hypothetical protein